jgi:multidrug efflux pump subunit AcrA (membrane-fusion protein)
MSKPAFLRVGTRVVLTSLILTVVFGSGLAVGLFSYPQVFASPDAEDEHDHHDDDHADDHHEEGEHEDEEHVALTEQAFQNLNLKLGTVTPGEYWKSQLMPGRVVEIPGKSELSVSSPVSGTIEEVRIEPGQAVNTKSDLFVVRLTDDAMLSAQSKYIDSLAREQVINQEITRLTPLVSQGVLNGKRKRELEYELKQVSAQQATLEQELRGRGLPEPLFQTLRNERRLASTLTVSLPAFEGRTDEPSDSESSAKPSRAFSVEDLLIHRGKTVERGEELCTVAYHETLYIEGTAFETDLRSLQDIIRNGWTITAQLHSEAHGPHSSHASHGNHDFALKLLRVDNHVDEETQTVRFFIELPNEVSQTVNRNGRQFDQWRFRPGQRMHLRLPIERWEDQLILPVDAVVVDGPNAFVFAEHHHEEHHHEEHHEDEHEDENHHDEDGHEHDAFIEFEPVPIRILHRDDRTIVVANDGQIGADTEIALNNAFKLYLAMKMQAGGGGGHHHHHDH